MQFAKDPKATPTYFGALTGALCKRRKCEVNQKLDEYIALSSIPIRSIGKDGMPTGIASACICSYAGKRILLTVHHATGNMEKWFIQLKFMQSKGTALQSLGPMNFLRSFDINTKVGKDIDFSFVEIATTVEPMSQEIDPRTGSIISEKRRLDSSVDFKTSPSSEESYGFSGQIMPEIAGDAFITELRIYTGLKYVGDEGEYYVFELPTSHPGHKHFQGCSGAPIIDTKGKAVALVCKGDISSNRIYGISLSRYEIAISATYGELSNVT